MNKANRLQNEISKLQRKLKTIQLNCKHKKREIKFLENNTARWICLDCQAILNIPSSQELDKWISR